MGFTAGMWRQSSLHVAVRLHQEQLGATELSALRRLPEPSVLYAERELNAV